MIQRGDEAYFAVESLAEALRGNFDRDVTIDLRIPRPINLPGLVPAHR
jgi:hypothetical protein